MGATWCGCTAYSHGMSDIRISLIALDRSILFFFTSLLASSWVNHVRITTLSQPRSLPLCHDAPADSDVPIARFQHRSLWKTWRRGRIVRRCISHSFYCLSTNSVSSCPVRAVNASELDRLKKRFMKLDRSRHPIPHPTAHCLLPSV